MTARRAERAALTAAAVVAGVLAGSTAAGVATAPAALAGWSTSASGRGQVVGLVPLAAAFDVRSGAAAGPQASPWTATGLVSGGSVLVDVVNSSAVPARLGVVLSSGGLLSSAPGVESCPVAWSAAATCTGSSAVAVTRSTSGGVNRSAWSVDLAAGERQRLKVTTSLALVGGFSLAVTPGYVLPATPADRTLG